MLQHMHPSKAVASLLRRTRPPQSSRQYATVAASTSAASSYEVTSMLPAISRFPSTQPPSYKPPEFRKSQLLRQYASLLRSTPLMLLFQHNNMKSSEWVGLRRELSQALRKLDEARHVAGYPSEPLAGTVRLQTIQTGIFAAALRIVEFYKPEDPSTGSNVRPRDNSLPPLVTSHLSNTSELGLGHTLSIAAHEAIAAEKKQLALNPLLSGPLVVLTFPSVSPHHLKAALSILAPSPPTFPAPTRRASPGWHGAAVQGGLQKLLLLGARIEGRAFDIEGTRWVGTIDGGLDGLRAQLVALLQGVGASITNTLESPSRSLYLTVEGRRTMLDDEVVRDTNELRRE